MPMSGHENAGQDDDPDEREDDVEPAGQHLRPGHDAEADEGDQQDGHALAAGDAEGERRQEAAALVGSERGVGRDDALDVALAEPLGVLRGLHGLRVGGDAADAGADAGQDADPQAEQARADDEAPMPEGVHDAFAGPCCSRCAGRGARCRPRRARRASSSRRRRTGRSSPPGRRCRPSGRCCRTCSAASPSPGPCRYRRSRRRGRRRSCP